MTEDLVAIVGIAVRLPGVRTAAELWQALRTGRDASCRPGDEELLAAGMSPAELADPGFVRAAYVVPGIEEFDAGFFGLNARDADILDPQHRVFLECVWEALETAGHVMDGAHDRIGVFAGSFFSTYLFRVAANRHATETVGQMLVRHGNDKDYLATRAAYCLDLRGPAVSVQTSCSTSLVATHLACRSLVEHECDTALAGGVSITIPQQSGYRFEERGILSPDGVVRAFDARARGTVFGNGAAVVVLRRLSDALADGDHVHAVLLGSALNNDGCAKVAFTAPSVSAQAQVVTEALAVAGVDPRTIGYVECHGTGTALGDPIEIAALTRAYRAFTAERGYCRIGSVKTNFGHLGAAGGVLGLAKAALAVEHGEIPPTLHFDTPNPEIDFGATPFVVNDTLSPWLPGAGPRRAAVSSFGMGGTNVHAILEQAPRRPRPAVPGSCGPVLMSARSPAALQRACADLAACLAAEPPELADVAFTTQVGRRAFAYRRAVCGRTVGDIAAGLAAQAAGPPAKASKVPPRLVFLFPGQGAQYLGMGERLYRTEPTFRSGVDRCAEALRPHVGADLREVLYPGEGDCVAARARLHRTNWTQPALFAVEYALAQLLAARGITAAAMVGHSLGEWVAACLAGVMSPEDAMALLAARGTALDGLPQGAMLAVEAPAETVAGLLAPAEAKPRVNGMLADGVALAAVNAPRWCTLSGTPAAIRAAQARLAEHRVRTRPLETQRAFHSPMVEPALASLAAHFAGVRLAAPQVPVISTVTGRPMADAEAMDSKYWLWQARAPVCFADALATVGPALFVEVGPGAALSTLAALNHPGAPAPVPLMPGPADPDSDDVTFAAGLGTLWAAGVPVEWARGWTGRPARRIALPTYPFQRQRHWIDEEPAAASAAPAPGPQVPVLSVPVWRGGPVSTTPAPGQDPGGAGPAGPAGSGAVIIDGGSPYAPAIAACLPGARLLPPGAPVPPGSGKVVLVLPSGGSGPHISLPEPATWVITAGACDVLGVEAVEPGLAAAAAQAAPSARRLDLPPPSAPGALVTAARAAAVAITSGPAESTVLAVRGAAVWAREHVPVAAVLPAVTSVRAFGPAEAVAQLAPVIEAAGLSAREGAGGPPHEAAIVVVPADARSVADLPTVPDLPLICLLSTAGAAGDVWAEAYAASARRAGRAVASISWGVPGGPTVPQAELLAAAIGLAADQPRIVVTPPAVPSRAVTLAAEASATAVPPGQHSDHASVEAQVTGIWAALLGAPPASLDEDFFDAGGDSLRAVQMVSRLRNAFSADLPLRDLFDRRSLRGIVEIVEAALADGAGDGGDQMEALLAEIEQMTDQEAQDVLRALADDTPEVADGGPA